MKIEEIIVALNEIDLDILSDKELSEFSEVLRAKSSDATRISYLRARQRSRSDPDLMAAD